MIYNFIFYIYYQICDAWNYFRDSPSNMDSEFVTIFLISTLEAFNLLSIFTFADVTYVKEHSIATLVISTIFFISFNLFYFLFKKKYQKILGLYSKRKIKFIFGIGFFFFIFIILTFYVFFSTVELK